MMQQSTCSKGGSGARGRLVPALVVLAVLLAIAPGAPAQDFNNQTDFARVRQATGLPSSALATSTKATALGDVSGNGELDLVVGYMSRQWPQSGTVGDPPSQFTIKWYQNDGTNTWTEHTLPPYTTQVYPSPQFGAFNKSDTLGHIQVVDVDGDGLRDIMFSTHIEGILWFRRTAAGSPGTWEATPRVVIGRNTGYNWHHNTRMFAAGDLDGDGDVDVAVVHGEGPDLTGPNTGSRIGFYWNNGSQAFTYVSIEDYNTTDFPVSIRMANVVGDARPELFVAARANNKVRWYANQSGTNGALTYNLRADIAAGTHYRPYDTAFGDANGDGLVDLFVSQRGTAGSVPSIRVFFNNGTVAAGNWASTANVDMARTPTDSAVRSDAYPIYLTSVDYDQDGDADLFASYNRLDSPAAAAGQVVYYQNLNGLGTSWAATVLPTGAVAGPPAFVADEGPMQIAAAPVQRAATDPPGFPDTYGDLVVVNSTSRTLSFWNQTTYVNAPYMSNLVVIGARTLHVTFSQPMNSTDATTAANYTASGGGRGTLAVTPNSVTFVSGNTYELSWSAGSLALNQPLTITAVKTMRSAAGYSLREPRALTVTVTDTTPPNAVCQDLFRTLAPTTTTVTAAQVNNGSTDNFAVSALHIKRTGEPDTSYAAQIVFDCADLGVQNVTLRVTDSSNNTATCTADITIDGTMQNVLTTPALEQLYLGDTLSPIGVTADCGIPGYTFLWQYSDAAGFASPQDIADGAGGHPADGSVTVTVGGASPSSTLTFAPLTLDVPGYYRSIAEDSLSTTATSAEMQLDVREPVAATDPVGGHRNTSGSILFETVASLGYAPYSYQWYFDDGGGAVALSNGPQPSGSTVTGADAASMTVSDLELADAGDYYCIVTDAVATGSGSVKQTNAATLTVTDLLAITDPAPSEANIYGTSQDFFATATGGDGNYTFTWQWRQTPAGSYVNLTGAVHPNGTTSMNIINAGGNTTLMLWNIIQNASGDYRCIVSDGSPDPDVTSNPANLQKRSAVSVSVTPNSVQRRNYIDTLTLTANPSGGFTPYTYQWALSTDGGTNWTDLVDGTATYSRPGFDPDNPGVFVVDVDVTITGAQGPVLVIDHPLFTIHGGLYRCTVEDAQYPIQSLPEGTASAQSTVTVPDQLAVVRHPTGGEYYEGNTEEVDVIVIGGTITAPDHYIYNWRLGGTPIDNSNLNPYSFVADADPPQPPGGPYVSTTGSPGNYSVFVSGGGLSGGAGATFSNSAAVDVKRAVEVTLPATDTKNVTETFTVTAVVTGGYPATGGVYSYSWTWDSQVLTNGAHPSGSGSVVSGANSGTLTITNLGPDDDGTYEVVANDSKSPCPEHNDLCRDTASMQLIVTNNLVIGDDPADAVVYVGDTVDFEVRAGGGDSATYEFDWKWDFGSGEITLPDSGPHPSGSGATITEQLVSTDTHRLTVNAADLGDAGDYYCIVRDANPLNAEAISNAGVLTVWPPLQITAQPQSLNRYVGQTAVFSVQATGGIDDDRSFQWQVDTGSGWNDLPNGGGVSGATTATLTLSSLTLGQDGRLYRCHVTAPPSDVTSPSSNREQFSGTATLNVSGPIVILNNPADVTAYVFDPAFTLKSEFEGGMPNTTPPEYQTNWRRTGIAPAAPEVSAGAGTLVLGNPNTASLLVTPGALGAGVFDLHVNLTDQVQTTPSGKARVTIVNALNFDKPLQNAIVRDGDRFEWSVEVSGGMLPLIYQWQMQIDDGSKALVWVDVLDDATHNGVDTDTLEFTSVGFDDAGTYRVNVADSGSQQISSSAQLIVQQALPVGGLAGLALAAMLTALGGATALRRRK